MNQSTLATFILGLLVGIMFALAFFAAPEPTTHQSDELAQRQILLDSKMHLIEMKFDVVTEQKDSTELQSDYDHMMTVLQQSHQYTGEGIIARDTAMREAAKALNDALQSGGADILESIETFIDSIENFLHTHEEDEQDSETL